MQQIIHRVFETSPERFWKMFLFDDPYRGALYVHMVGQVRQRHVGRPPCLLSYPRKSC
jgi:hypothetical protein